MSKKPYPLETLLEIREREVEEAEMALAAGQRAQGEIEELKDRMLETKDAIERTATAEAVSNDRQVGSGSATVADMHLFSERQVGLRCDLGTAMEQLAEIETEIGAAEVKVSRLRDVLAERIAEREALGVLRDRWRNERRREVARDEANELDGLVLHQKKS
jgi:flagellar export protein FliJ